jgi:subtilisin family serine protease
MLRRYSSNSGEWLGQLLALAASMAIAALLLIGCGTSGRTVVDEQSSGSAGAVGNVPQENIVFNRFVLVYSSGVVPDDVAARVAKAGAVLREQFPTLGMVVVDCPANVVANVMVQLQADSSVAYVLHDRVVAAHRLRIKPMDMHLAVPAGATAGAGSTTAVKANSTAPPTNPGNPTSPTSPSAPSGDGDSYYTQGPQGWAVSQVGGYGGGIVSGGGAPTHGPWDTTMGANVRIAVLDTGVDEAHPDIAPNLIANISEVNLAELPTSCDDGTPWDQTGHGTWVASLAAGAAGASTGKVIGVAPQAALINIKVMERASSTGSSSATAECEAGEGSGLLSWVIAGINDAVTQHANVIVMSLGTLVDLDTGDGAGWQATFNSVTYRAFESGSLIVAAAGNDSYDLSSSHYSELPAMARDVLPVVASTNAACAENLAPNAVCAPGPVTLAYYSNYGAGLDLGASLGAVAAPGGSYPESADDTGVSGYVRGACSNGELNTVEGLPGAGPSGNGQSLGCFNLGHAQYVQAIGTSASAPLAGGVAALIIASHPGWSLTQVVNAMESTATLGSTAGGKNFGYGQVNAAAVVE